MCAFGMKSSDERGEGYVYKPIKLMTNYWVLANDLDRFKCRGDHRHVHLLSGRAAKAAVYLDKLCAVICEGIRDQLQYDQIVASIEFPSGNNVCSIGCIRDAVYSMVKNKYVHNDEDDC